jgi:uncharacterized protein YbaR (Trm112 family)
MILVGLGVLTGSRGNGRLKHMRTAFLEILRCPFCASMLRPQRLAPNADGEDVIDWGLLTCECDSPHPVLDGIPIFAPQADPRAAEARVRDWPVQGFRNQSKIQALEAATNPPRRC